MSSVILKIVLSGGKNQQKFEINSDWISQHLPYLLIIGLNKVVSNYADCGTVYKCGALNAAVNLVSLPYC